MNELKQTTCKRCGRRLKSPQAIEIGMGVVCWRKFQAENHYKKLWRKKNEADKDD